MDTGHVVNRDLDLIATMFPELEVEENEYVINEIEGYKFTSCVRY